MCAVCCHTILQIRTFELYIYIYVVDLFTRINKMAESGKITGNTTAKIKQWTRAQKLELFKLFKKFCKSISTRHKVFHFSYLQISP